MFNYTLTVDLYKVLSAFYRIENYTPDLPWQEVRRVLADAFKVWSDVTDLTFTEVMNTEADIMIKFASRYHKDGYPFDGKGNLRKWFSLEILPLEMIWLYMQRKSKNMIYLIVETNVQLHHSIECLMQLLQGKF